jgi:rRNA-processing protein FCF1
MAREILLDTNALMLPFQTRIDVISEVARLFGDEPHRLVVLDAAAKELDNIALGVGPERRAALSAKEYMERLVAGGKLSVVKAEKTDVDEAIADYALKHGAVVVTNDYKLKQALRKAGIRVVTGRKDHLVLI